MSSTTGNRGAGKRSTRSSYLSTQHAAYRCAVDEYGDLQTLELIELWMGRLPLKTKLEAAMGHPAFQLMSRSHQNDIRKRQDPDVLKLFIRNLLSTLAVKHKLHPLSKSSPRTAFDAKIKAVRAKIRL